MVAPNRCGWGAGLWGDRERTGMTAKQKRKWSAQVSEHSDALDLEKGVFASHDPEKIAASLKRSAEKSGRRKSSPFRSAMSMLTFFANRAGAKLYASQRKVLDRAKAALRRDFGKPRKS